MAKIIEHNFKGKIRTPREDLLTRSFHNYMKAVEDKKALIGEMVTQARIFLAQEGMPPGDFIMSETYLSEVIMSSLARRESKEDSYDELVYLRRSDDCITALCQFAVPEEDGITISYQIYRLEQFTKGNIRWKVYNFHEGNWIDDEEDCFDLKTVLKDIDRFYSS